MQGIVIMVFSGTTEGRLISEYLSSKEVNHTVCVATDSGLLAMEPSDFAKVRVGRLEEGEMEALFSSFDLVIDATHPYALIVTQNIKKACESTGTGYVRIKRGMIAEIRNPECSAGDRPKESPTGADEPEPNINIYPDFPACLDALKSTEGLVMFTTGSKDLYLLRGTELASRAVVRVLPSVESIGLCADAGIAGRNIIAMYGPHSLELNLALIRQYGICHLVTKESGRAGGFEEKLQAARVAGIQLHIIGRMEEDGIDVEECKAFLEEIWEKYT